MHVQVFPDIRQTIRRQIIANRTGFFVTTCMGTLRHVTNCQNALESTS